MARVHSRKEGYALMTKPGQHGDFLRLQGTPDHCLLKAVKIMRKVEMDGPKRGSSAMQGGGGAGLSDTEEQLGMQRPTGTPGPRRPTRAEPAHLDPIQQLAHAPKAVSFDAPQHVLR